ncbi:hypothetical protein F5B20DRAFT_521448 [Whalleya microplaca]|nr:hypothetical protein F5B20DRAFT_521448 [Whalleya microplaca]
MSHVASHLPFPKFVSLCPLLLFSATNFTTHNNIFSYPPSSISSFQHLHSYFLVLPIYSFAPFYNYHACMRFHLSIPNVFRVSILDYADDY